MIKNYFKTAFRNLMQNKSYSFVNIMGLVVGISGCLLLFLILQYEQSFDNFHHNKDQIYRLVRVGKNPVGREYRSGVPFPVTNGIRADYPQLENAAAVFEDDDVQVLIPGAAGEIVKKFKEKGVFQAEPQFFQLFNFKPLAGDPKSALSEPNTVMLTKATANKYFGDWKTAVGKMIRVYDKDTKVTGVLDNPPANTDFQLNIVISYATLLKQVNMNNWVGISDNNYCFVELPAGYSPELLNTKLKSFVTKHMPPEHSGYNLVLQPLSEIHYDDRFGNFTGRTFSKSLITALYLIGLFLLIVACVNFINLSTAQAINRAKEVGVRKVLGGSRPQLLIQFLGETALIAFVALLLATVLAVLALPFINQLLEIRLSLNPLSDPSILIFMFSLFAAITLCSGFYPALILSGFNPINALKSKAAGQSVKGISLRRGLVVLQFAIAQVLIIGTLVVISQLNYFKNADTGYNKTAIVNIPFPGGRQNLQKEDLLRDQLNREPGVKAISLSAGMPSGGVDGATDLQLPENNTKKADIVVGVKLADPAFFDIYKLKLAAGRIYLPSDTVKEFVVNETLIKSLNLGTAKEAVGKQIRVMGRLLPIVGVLKDFHVSSLRDPISPMVMTTMKNAYGSVNIQLQPGKVNQTISALQVIWNKTYPDYVFEYNFIDQTVADYYKQENQLTTLYKLFAGITIFISCLGLYGLISFMATRRNKEIGIRKVLGASASSIVYLLTQEFTVLITIAFVISSPIAWYLMHQWLQQYVLRIDLSIGFFIATILLSLVIAWLTIGYSAIRAATANPAGSLRSE
jgi:predicted permease